MCSCYSILECYNLFYGVELCVRLFCFIYVSIFGAFHQEIHKQFLTSIDNRTRYSTTVKCNFWNVIVTPSTLVSLSIAKGFRRNSLFPNLINSTGTSREDKSRLMGTPPTPCGSSTGVHIPKLVRIFNTLVLAVELWCSAQSCSNKY